MEQSVQEQTKKILWKRAFEKFTWSTHEYFVPDTLQKILGNLTRMLR